MMYLVADNLIVSSSYKLNTNFSAALVKFFLNISSDFFQRSFYFLHFYFAHKFWLMINYFFGIDILFEN